MDARVHEREEPPTLLLVDDDDLYATVLARALERRGYEVRVARGLDEAIEASSRGQFEFAVIDLKLPDGSGLKLVPRLRLLNPAMRIVVLTGHGSIPTAIEAIKLGATYYLTKPAGADDVVAAFARDGADDDVPVNEKPMSVSRVEWEHINQVLREYHGNVSATARALSMHRRTLQRKLAKHPVRS